MNRVPVIFAAIFFFSIAYYTYRYGKWKGKNAVKPPFNNLVIQIVGIVFAVLGLYTLSVLLP